MLRTVVRFHLPNGETQTDNPPVTEKLLGNFCTSPPFCNPSRYGNIVFRYSISEVIKAYSIQFCQENEPSFLVMGTFSYRQEVMHAILVCPREIAQGGHFPIASARNSVIFKSSHDWVWKPESTGCVWNVPISVREATTKFRRWEHTTFAFCIPDQSRILTLNNFDMHMEYSPPAEIFRLHTPENRRPWSFSSTLSFLQTDIKMGPVQLLEFIYKHIVRNWPRMTDLATQQNNSLSSRCACKYGQLNVKFLDSLLGRTQSRNESVMYCLHELLTLVAHPSDCTERWQLWIRERASHIIAFRRMVFESDIS